MQHRITEPGPLLTKDGCLREPGWATELLLDYHRKDIGANALRVKEWDYYLITNGRWGVALTVADNGYMGLDSISFLDFENRWEKTTSPMRILPMGRTHLPETSKTGNVFSSGKGYQLLFENQGDSRRLVFHMDNFMDGKPIDGGFLLENTQQDSMVIATPFAGKPKAFYYNQKINCFRVSGSVDLDGKTYVFSPEDTFAVLDWGRGVWTYDNTWYWSSASGTVDGVTFGFNLGYGFGDTRAASENMLFYDGRAHKLERVLFQIPVKDDKEDYMSPWLFTSSDRRLNLKFQPVLDRMSKTVVGPLCSDQHQVFGRFTGTVVLDDGTPVEIRDFFGFAEKVRNKW